MPKFYFAYGTHGQPFFGGWTEVEAPDEKTAVALFRMFHSDTENGYINCGGIYSEEQFELTGMKADGNYGYRCHEKISLNRIFTSAYAQEKYEDISV